MNLALPRLNILMVLARTDANVAKAEWEAIQMKFESWRTLESTKRAEMNLR